MTTQERIDQIEGEIEVLENEKSELYAKLTVEENAAKGITFAHELEDIEFPEFGAGLDLLTQLRNHCSSNLRDIYDFNSWDEVDDEVKYFMYKDKIYKIEIEEDGCVESTHDHRIMEFNVTVTLVQ